MALETAVILLESVLPSLLEQAVLEVQGPGFKDSLVGLLQPLLGLRYTDPVMVALVSFCGFTFFIGFCDCTFLTFFVVIIGSFFLHQS